MFSHIAKLFAGNQFLSGGMFLGATAGLVAVLKGVPKKIFGFIKSKLTCTIEIDSSRPAYEWLNLWLSKYPKQDKFRSSVPEIKWAEDFTGIRGRSIPAISFVPTQGNYLLRYKGRLCFTRIVKDSPNKESFDKEKITIFMSKLGKSRQLFTDLLNDCYNLANPNVQNEVSVFYFDGILRYWRLAKNVKMRPRETLIYANGIMERIESDAIKFVGSKEWYEKMGVPWRRGYLFYGPPGSGKSSLAMFVAAALKTDVCFLNLSALRGDSDLLDCLTTMPQGCILVIEDIDAMFKSRESENDSKGAKAVSEITLSGLLNALDGPLAKEGRILIMTTNHKDKVDPAIIRAGRVDIHEYIGNATTEQIETLFLRFFPESLKSTARQFALFIPNGEISMSRLQEFFLRNREVTLALKNVKDLVHEIANTGEENKEIGYQVERGIEEAA